MTYHEAIRAFIQKPGQFEERRSELDLEELLAVQANKEISGQIGARRMLLVSGCIMNSMPCPLYSEPAARRVTYSLSTCVEFSFFEANSSCVLKLFQAKAQEPQSQTMV